MADTAAKKQAAKDLAANIVRRQTNRYVKELLHTHGIPIGTTKAHFELNIAHAIDDDKLTLKDLEDWLDAVEGWGSQHVYVFRLSKDDIQRFGSEQSAFAQITAGRLKSFWNKTRVSARALAFPSDDDGLHLVSITHGTDGAVLFHWHNGTTYWIRTRDEQAFDKPNEEIGGFQYQFRAYRGRVTREVMRFEIRPDLGLAALFIPKPINSAEHAKAYETAQGVINRVLDYDRLDDNKLKTRDVIRNLDQVLSRDDTGSPKIEVQSTRLQDDMAYVEFAARTLQGSYRSSEAVKKVREGIVTPAQVRQFDGAAGTFNFVGFGKDGFGRVQLFPGGRIRLWKSLKRDEVWQILIELEEHEVTS